MPIGTSHERDSDQIVVGELWSAMPSSKEAPPTRKQCDGVVRCEGAKELRSEKFAAFLGERSALVGCGAFEDSQKYQIGFLSDAGQSDWVGVAPLLLLVDQKDVR